jgi:ORF6N domain
MLDFDLSELYQVETKRLNQHVKRNIDRFPEEFMFRLTQKEWDGMRSQFVTSSQKKRKLHDIPYAFTEHGVTMLASILRSDTAIKMNIAVVKAFIAYKKIVLYNHELSEKLEQLRQEMYGRLGEHDIQLNQIYDAIENILDEKVNHQTWNDRDRIGFK